MGERLKLLKAAAEARAITSTETANSNSSAIVVREPRPGSRLALLKAAAEERGPTEAQKAEEEIGEWTPSPTRFAFLPPIAPELLFPKMAAERAVNAGGYAGLDCETALIQPARLVPRLIVTGYQNADGTQEIVTGSAHDPAVHARGFLSFTDRILNSDTILVNQNVAFDECAIAESAHQADIALGLVGTDDSWLELTLRRMFEMHDRKQIEDSWYREQLIDLAEGTLGKDFASLTAKGTPRRKRYDLKTLAKNYLDTALEKLVYRLGYSAYRDKDISEYPQGAVDYLTDDVESALHVASRQNERARMHGLPEGERIPNSPEQSRAAFAFQLMSSWGVRTDLSVTQQLDSDLDIGKRRLLNVLKETGLVRSEGKNAGSRDTKKTRELVAQCYEEAGLVVPMTKPKNGKGGGNISTKGSVLEDIALIRLRGSSADVLNEKGEIDETDLFREPLYAFSQYTSFEKIANTYLPVLYQGTQFPINARYDIIKETGRVSCWKPNLSNLPRGGSKTVLQRLQSKVRQAFVPREGFVFCSTDLDVAELCGLAQICIWMVGYSKLADAINAGIDPHLSLAADQLLHIPYEEALAKKKTKMVADARQLAKSASFGFPGGLGIHTFIEFAKASYNVFITEEEARVLKAKYFAQWPEMVTYFRMIANMMRGFDEKGNEVGDIEQFVSGRIRGRCRYTAACNTTFQGIVADSAKHALYEMQRECYLKGGAMYGARCSVFVHDEVITELPEHKAHEYAQVQADIMMRTMQEYCPDVRINAKPALMRRWYKDAEPVYVNDRLVPWEPT